MARLRGRRFDPRAGHRDLGDEGLGAFFVVLLALRNWKLHRTDMQGAWRVAVARFLLAGIAWAGMVHPVTSDAFLEHAVAAAGDWLFAAAVLFLVYLALEPAVRARWPHSIVTWNRVLAGRWRDPQVASDVLIGAAVGTGNVHLLQVDLRVDAAMSSP